MTTMRITEKVKKYSKSASRQSSIILFSCLIITSVSALAHIPCSAEITDKLISQGGFMVENGTATRQYRAQELFIPASTLKIVTCLTALELLGSDYRFETHFFLDPQNNLYIKGYGDPFLTSETILDVGQTLYRKGVSHIGSIFLDESAFSLNGPTAGSENSAKSYDAPNGALAVNFNALPILVTSNGTITSGEPQTPILPLMVEIGTKLGPGFHRVNPSAFPLDPAISPTLRYTGELFAAQLQRAGISVEKGYRTKMVPDNLKPLLIYKNTLTLTDMVRACLKSSNNFVANQLYLYCGLMKSGLPATWQKSQQTFAEYIKASFAFTPADLHMVEGSGLSRENRTTAAALVLVLKRFMPFANLLNLHDGVLLKTGTMSDIFCYAGYFQKGDKLIPFAILLNQKKNSREDILKLLQHNADTPATLPLQEIPGTVGAKL